jgi:hypothetical protein
MSDENKRNLLYFESSSMRALYECIESWQIANQKRLLSISIQQDGGSFCCIALTNPTEVLITDQRGRHARMDSDNCLVVWNNSNPTRS